MPARPTIASKMPAPAKWAFSTRRVAREHAISLVDLLDTAESGDLVLGRVDRIGSHKRIQLAEGRASELYTGDLVVLACGDRYAPDQFEGLGELDPSGSDMLAAGGILGRMRYRHARISPPTRVTPLGIVADASGTAINVARYALPRIPRPTGLTAIGVVGASMNSGKTTATAALARGLSRAGYRVAAIKATGTGAFGDFHTFVDTGAHYVADFTDAGMVSTYRQPLDRIEAGLHTLLGHAANHACEIAVVELADGLFQKETADLLQQPRVRDGFAGVVFAAPDALAAAGGCAVLRGMGIEPKLVTGMVSCSPLASAETEAATGVQVIGRDTLRDPDRATSLFAAILDGGATKTALIQLPEVGVAA